MYSARRGSCGEYSSNGWWILIYSGLPVAWKLVMKEKSWTRTMEIYNELTVSKGGVDLHSKPVFWNQYHHNVSPMT